VSEPFFEIPVVDEPAHYVTFDLNGAGKVLAGFSVRVFGFAIKNPSGSTAAALDLYDGTDTTGIVVIPVVLASSDSAADWYGPNGVWFKNGLYANVTAGEAKGSIFLRHVR
jgi:hypothetical protein